MRFSPQWRAIFRHRNFKKWPGTVSFSTRSLANALLATAARNFSTSELQKAVRSWGVLCILTWKCASRHSSVQPFDIRTSKSGPELRCLVHLDFKACFSPQRRFFFDIGTFKSGPTPSVFTAFSLANALLAAHRIRSKRHRISRLVHTWRGWIFFLLTLLL